MIFFTSRLFHLHVTVTRKEEKLSTETVVDKTKTGDRGSALRPWKERNSIQSQTSQVLNGETAVPKRGKKTVGRTVNSIDNNRKGGGGETS